MSTELETSAGRLDEELLSQRAFLLTRMRADKQHRLTGAALKKLPKAAVAELRLDGERIASVLAGLVQEGLVSEKAVRKSISWHLTESGAAYLATLPAWPPAAVVKPVHDDARLLSQQQAYALFQLFIARGGKLSAAQLRTKLTAAKAKPVRFDAATVEWVLSLLVAEGVVIEHRRGKTVSWQPGEKAPGRLARLEQRPEVELTLNGVAWNAVKLANLDSIPSLIHEPPPQPSPEYRGRE